MKNLFFLAANGLISKSVLNLTQSYQCHRLQILQQEGHVENNHKFQINPLGFRLQKRIYLILFAMFVKVWKEHVEWN